MCHFHIYFLAPPTSALLSDKPRRFIHFLFIYFFKLLFYYSGGFEWEDDTAVDYVNWANDEPNGDKSGQNCVMMYDDQYGKWNDDDCYASAAVVCQLKQCKFIVFILSLLRVNQLQCQTPLSKQAVCYDSKYNSSAKITARCRFRQGWVEQMLIKSIQ